MNPYELSTDELLRQFMSACSRTEGGRAYAHYLRGAVLARIDGATPPLKPGTKVQVNKTLISPAGSNGYERIGRPRGLPNPLTVKTIYYMGGNKWEYKFAEVTNKTAHEELQDDGDKTWKELVPLRFKAEDFDLIEDPVSVPPSV